MLIPFFPPHQLVPSAPQTSVAAVAAARQEDMWLTSADGQRLRASLWLPRPEARPAPLVLLLHQMGRDRHSFDRLAPLLADRGLAVMSVDLRGHGDSASSELPDADALLAPEHEALWSNIFLDGEALLSYAARRPEINSSRVAIVGASIGAGMGGWLAHDHPRSVRGVVQLSPGPGWRFQDRLDRARAVSLPTWYLVSQGDQRSVGAVARLMAISAGRRDRLTTVSGSAHGTDILAERERLWSDIAQYVQERLNP